MYIASTTFLAVAVGKSNTLLSSGNLADSTSVFFSIFASYIQLCIVCLGMALVMLFGPGWDHTVPIDEGENESIPIAVIIMDFVM